MNKMKGRNGFFAIKVDLAKAYDRLRWSFIEGMLIEVGLPNIMVQFIMNCVTSVKTNVMWNGNRAKYFAPQRGIRQGDPMSPYIFVLCIDKLYHLISQAVEEDGWKPLREGRNMPMVSHLMFVDDLLLFGKADASQIRCVNRVLEEFCRMSGQKVSVEKTSIFFLQECGPPN